MIVDPRRGEPASLWRLPSYTEDGCARGPRLYANLLLPGAFLLATVASAAVGVIPLALLLFLGFLLFGFITLVGLLIRMPLGIRLDENGVRIGGIRYNERHPGRIRRRHTPLRGYTRALHVYTSSWHGVRRATVVTGRSDLRLLGRRFGAGTNVPWWAEQGVAAWAPGRFTSPSAKALFVVEVDRESADFQAFRPPKGKRGAMLADVVYNSPRMVWIIPTRDPERLLAALRGATPPVPES